MGSTMGMETKPVPQSVVTNVQYVAAARRRLQQGQIRRCHPWAGYSPLCSVRLVVGLVVLYLAAWIVCRLQPILAQVATSPSASIIQARLENYYNYELFFPLFCILCTIFVFTEILHLKQYFNLLNVNK